jgi:putative toxin-antitoxin system antitoxin component (TIGR02293 family)
MPQDRGTKTGIFVEPLAKAADVFGGKDAAERWMSEEAMGLDGARPVDLLQTSRGAKLVNQFLDRLKYGVYN